MSLATLHDLFRCCREKETGHWRVGNGNTRTVHLDSGDIVFASSTFPTDRLTAVMVEQGKLTQEQMDHALTNLKPGMSVGKNLIEMGFITQRDLLDMARLQVEKIVWSAMLADEPPVFESLEELEENIVRLPLDTPTLLFKGIMRMSDRESLLEMLGPLNQVVLLQGKRVYDIDLPDDMRKLVPLLDGSHTILELSTESGVESIKIGAFGLFLREMGWGKLFELPPLDRKEITKALDPPEPTRPPPSDSSGRPKWFDDIEEAAKVTTKLPTTKLDPPDSSVPPNGAPEELGPVLSPEPASAEFEPEPLVLPEGPPPLEPPADPVPIGPVGKVLQAEPEIAPPEKEPAMTISLGGPFEDIEKEKTDPPKQEQKAKPIIDENEESELATEVKTRALPRLLIIAVALLIMVFAAYQYVWPMVGRLKNKDPKPPFTLSPPDDGLPDVSAEPVAADQLGPAAQEGAPSAQDLPALTPDREARPAQATEPASPDITKEARYGALANGNIDRALKQGSAFQASLPKSNWTIRLIVASQWDNVQYCVQTLGPRQDLFLRPYRLRNGQQCYQLFVGRFPNKVAAEAEQAKILPLIEKKVEPKILQISDISENQ